MEKENVSHFQHSKTLSDLVLYFVRISLLNSNYFVFICLQKTYVHKTLKIVKGFWKGSMPQKKKKNNNIWMISLYFSVLFLIVLLFHIIFMDIWNALSLTVLIFSTNYVSHDWHFISTFLRKNVIISLEIDIKGFHAVWDTLLLSVYFTFTWKWDCMMCWQSNF